MSLYTPYRSLLAGLIILLLSTLHFASYGQEQPRYNRFQYHKYHWKAYHGRSFHIYFPADAADSLYRFVLKETAVAIAHIHDATIKEVPRDINIIVYPSVNQLYETNIGGFEPAPSTLPTFVLRGTRVVLAYNGSYADLKRQLYEALARSLWETELKEGGAEDKLKGPASGKASSGHDIPFWYKEGCIRYFANGWTIDAEDKLRNSFEENHFTSWQQVLSYEPRLGGQAFCYFLARRYYPMAVAQTFFQIVKKKSLSKGIRLITKCSLDTLYQQCFSYYTHRFSSSDTGKAASGDRITIQHKKGIVSNVLFNPTKEYVAYVCLAGGRRCAYIYNLKDKKTKRIATYKLPPWIDEHSADQYPLISWHKDGRQLYVAKPRKGKLDIRRYAADGAFQESVTMNQVDGITSIEPLSDREFLLSAYRKGQSDIVSYNDDKERYSAYTDDEYDDGKPSLTGNGNEVLFLSNRPKEYQQLKTFLIGVGYKKDTLWQGIYAISGKELKPIAIDTTGYVKFDKPILTIDGKLLATSTRYGTERSVVFNGLAGKATQLDSYHPFQYLSQTSEVSSYHVDRDSIYTMQEPIAQWLKEHTARPSDITSPWLTDHRAILAAQAKEDSLLKSATDTNHYFMDDIFSPQVDTTKQKKGKRKGRVMLAKSEVEPYVLQLHSAYFSAQVNNDYLINKYQPFKNYQGQFKFPELGGMTKGGFTDLLENHHFTIAYALPAATEGSTFFARYENTERKIDWGISYFRKVETLKPDPSRNWVDENGNKYPDNAKVKTHYYDLFFKYPLTYDCALGLKLAVRQDKTVFLATDKYTLDFPPIQSAWSINTLSFGLNKLKPTIPYLYKGFKVDAATDLFKGVSHEEAFLAGMTIDLRYDKPLYKFITLVAQLHAGYSIGDEKVLYNLGGEDNNVTPRVDTNVHFAQAAPYAFQTLVTPFRGYYQNTIYGNQYMLANVDIYFPIFRTLIPLETPLPSINNLQLGLLSDLGSARETWNDTNPNNNKWRWSYGMSARTTLAGYPLRLDFAWPGTFHKQPVIYFSLNLQ